MQVQSLHQIHISKSDRFKLLEQISNWERIEYGENFYRKTACLLSCATKFDHTFFVAHELGKVFGYLDLWLLDPVFYERLKIGVVAEEELCEAAIINTETASALEFRNWYIGSVITDPAIRMESPVDSTAIFSRLYKAAYDNFLSAATPLTILGVGSSEFGQRLLLRHGFEPVTAAPNAKDLRPRFEKKMRHLALKE